MRVLKHLQEGGEPQSQHRDTVFKRGSNKSQTKSRLRGFSSGATGGHERSRMNTSDVAPEYIIPLIGKEQRFGLGCHNGERENKRRVAEVEAGPVCLGFAPRQLSSPPACLVPG